MTRENFNIGCAKLLSAFMNQADKFSVAAQEVYWEALQGIPDDLWKSGLTNCLQNCQFFPTIHELGAACCGEQKEQTVWREDPWRTRQQYSQKIEPVSWQHNLKSILADRRAVAAPAVVLSLEPAEKPDYIKCEPVNVRELLRNCLADLERKLAERETRQEEDRTAMREERRQILEAQAELLNNLKP